MTAFAEFLKTTVEESFKKVIQPSGLIPAAIFVLLNLGFVYPSVKQVRVVGAFASLDKVWQLTVLVAVLLILSYILTSVASTILDVLSGDAWRGSLLYVSLGRLQRRRRERLAEEEAGKRDSDRPREVARWELDSRFAAEGETPPTAFGNVLKASQYLIEKRYGIDLVALWPQMEAVAPKDSAALAAEKDQKAGLELLGNLTAVLAIFGIEVLALFAAKDQGKYSLFSLLAFLGAYVSYRIAITKARDWGDSLEVVFDVHRPLLKKELGLRKATTASDERDLWHETSVAFLQPTGLDNVLDEPKKPDKAAYDTSPNLKLEKAVEAVVEDPATTAPAQHSYRELVRYVLFLTRLGDAFSPIKGWAYVDDARVPSIREDPLVYNNPPASATIVPHGKGGDGLLWELGPLTRDQTLALQYDLLIWSLAVEPTSLTVTSKERGNSIRVTITNPSGIPSDPVKLTYIDGRLRGKRRTLAKDGEHSPQEPQPGVLIWNLNPIPANGTVTVILQPVIDDEEDE